METWERPVATAKRPPFAMKYSVASTFACGIVPGEENSVPSMSLISVIPSNFPIDSLLSKRHGPEHRLGYSFASTTCGMRVRIQATIRVSISSGSI